jgi:hypothetical protein
MTLDKNYLADKCETSAAEELRHILWQCARRGEIACGDPLGALGGDALSYVGGLYALGNRG